MDDILESDSGSFCFLDLHSRIAKGIREDMGDPKIDMFCNLRWMTVDNMERFKRKIGGIVEEIDGDFKRDNDVESSCMNRAKKKRKVWIQNQYATTK
jgi:hypothetical protein